MADHATASTTSTDVSVINNLDSNQQPRSRHHYQRNEGDAGHGGGRGGYSSFWRGRGGGNRNRFYYRRNKPALDGKQQQQPPQQQQQPQELVGDQETQQQQQQQLQQQEEIQYHGNCLVCCEPTDAFSLYQCNHNDLCWLCTFRMRELLGDKKCCICKEDSPTVIVTIGHAPKKFEEYNLGTLMYDQKFKAYTDSELILDRIRSLREFRCTKCVEPKTFNSLGQLERHMKDEHGLFYCDLCLRDRKVFLPDQKLYTRKELQRHMKYGDQDDENGLIKAHPECVFCKKRFYSDDEIFKHMNSTHETCHICEKQGILFQFYKDYPALENHFRNSHYLCEHPECLEKKFMVFPTEFELITHEAKAHQLKKGQKFAKINVAFGDDSDHQFSTSGAGNTQSSRNRNQFFSSSSIRFMKNNRPIAADRSDPGDHDNRRDRKGKGVRRSGSDEDEGQTRASTSAAPPPPPPAKVSPRIEQTTSDTMTSASANSSTDTNENVGAFSKPDRKAASMSDAAKEGKEPDVVEKNKLLIQKMKDALLARAPSAEVADQKFAQFRKVSSQFQKEKMLASEYYEQFVNLFGTDDRAAEIFSLMVEILPDPNKRDALLLARNVKNSKEFGVKSKEEQEAEAKKQKKAAKKEAQKATTEAATVSSSSSASSSKQPRTAASVVAGPTPQEAKEVEWPSLRPGSAAPAPVQRPGAWGKNLPLAPSDFPSLRPSSSSAAASSSSSSAPQWPVKQQSKKNVQQQPRKKQDSSTEWLRDIQKKTVKKKGVFYDLYDL